MTALKAVSASYDTQAFIPEQRGSGTAEQRGSGIPGQRGSSGQSATSARVRPSMPKRPEDSRKLKRVLARRWRLSVAVTAAVVTARGRRYPHPRRRHRRQTPKKSAGQRSQSGFQPWDIGLSARGAKAEGLPRCTYTPHELYCAPPWRPGRRGRPGRRQTSCWSRGDTDQGSHYSTTAPPAPSGGLLQIVSGDGRRLTALDPATGTTRWSRDTARYQGRIATVGGVVLLTGPDGKVTALDAATGEEKLHRSSPASRHRASSRTRTQSPTP